MHKAFFEGTASPLLLWMWEVRGKNTANPYRALLFRRIAIKLGVLISIGFLFPSKYQTWFALAMGLWTVLTPGFYLGWFRFADLRFLRDCWELNKTTGHRNYWPEEVTEAHLEKKAEWNLIQWAVQVLSEQEKLKPGAAAKSLKRFKQRHKAALRFGLVEKEWDSYFEKAKQRIKQQQEPAIV